MMYQKCALLELAQNTIKMKTEKKCFEHLSCVHDCLKCFCSQEGSCYGTWMTNKIFLFRCSQMKNLRGLEFFPLHELSQRIVIKSE